VFLHPPRELDLLKNVLAPRIDMLKYRDFYAVVSKIKCALFSMVDMG
jgi:hypothetical protein